MFLKSHAVEEKWGENVSSGNRKVKSKPREACRKDSPKIRDCYVFRKMTLGDHWKLVREQYLSCRCLGSHGKFLCKVSNCGEYGCEERHHKFLHPGNSHSTTDSPKTTSTVLVPRQFNQSVLVSCVVTWVRQNHRDVRISGRRFFPNAGGDESDRRAWSDW